MAPRSLHPTHNTDIRVTETGKWVEFQPVCRCGPLGDRMRLHVPYRPRDRIAAYKDAVAVLRRHEDAMGVNRQWADSGS